MTHYGSKDLTWVDQGEGWEVAEVKLAEGDSAWNPASTSRMLYGPATVVYERGPSGSVTAIYTRDED